MHYFYRASSPKCSHQNPWDEVCMIHFLLYFVWWNSVEDINALKTDGDFCHQGRDTEIVQNI
jgi:hypothetical protein